jgi:hypothetical protein
MKTAIKRKIMNNSQGSSSAVAPRFNLLPGQGYRGGNSREAGLAAFIRETTLEVVKDLSPKCEQRSRSQVEEWRWSFKGKISPGIPGVDAEALFDMERKRGQPTERRGNSIIKVANGKEKFFKDEKRAPMPKKARGLLARLSDPCPELPEVSARSVEHAPNPLSSFRPPSAKKRKVVFDPVLVANSSGKTNQEPCIP